MATTIQYSTAMASLIVNLKLITLNIMNIECESESKERYLFFFHFVGKQSVLRCGINPLRVSK